MKLALLVIGLLVLAGLAACGGGGGGDGEQGDRPQTVTVEKPAPSRPAPAEEPAPRRQGGGTIRVPNVVGRDHQLAQDTVQAAGLYNLEEQDATGQDRLLLYDRNWVVVRQDPPAGSRVDEDETITLFSKKKGE